MMMESEMAEQALKFLRNQKQFQWVKQEVPFLSRCIDVLLLDNNQKLISIEFKISKWRHAIEQAHNHKLGADYAYICLPKRNLTPTLITALEESGVGLMFFDSECSEIIKEVFPPQKDKSSIPVFREMLLQNAFNVL